MSEDVKWGKQAVRNALMQLVPELAAENTLDTAKRRIEEVENGKFHEYNVALDKSVKKYQETALTDKDLAKIKKIEGEIAKINKKIEEVALKVAKERDKDLKAVEEQRKTDPLGAMASFHQVYAEIQQESAKRTTKEAEEIRIRQKHINSLTNKKIIAATHVYDTEMKVPSGKAGEKKKSTAYSVEGERFYIESPRKRLGYSVNAMLDYDTRRIWVFCTGDAWSSELKSATPHFAGFWLEKSKQDQKNSIHTRSRLCWLVYDWITVAQQRKPADAEELLEVTLSVNDRIRLGNMQQEYSAGAANCYRLVETIEKKEEDRGHQRMFKELVNPDWDSLEEHEAVVNALIDAEIDQNEEEAAQSDEKVVEKAA